VTAKSVGAHLWLEVPDHQAVVERRGDQLLHVWVESHCRDAIFVPAKGPLQRRVLGLEAFVRHGNPPEANHGVWLDGSCVARVWAGRTRARPVNAFRREETVEQKLMPMPAPRLISRIFYANDFKKKRTQRNDSF
jgi:hypothetical protein